MLGCVARAHVEGISLGILAWCAHADVPEVFFKSVASLILSILDAFTHVEGKRSPVVDIAQERSPHYLNSKAYKEIGPVLQRPSNVGNQKLRMKMLVC